MSRSLLTLQGLHTRFTSDDHSPATGIGLSMRNRRLPSSRSYSPSLSSSTVVGSDIGVVDLMAREFVRGGEGTGSDAEEEAEVLVFEFGLEGADDGARVAQEGSWHGEMWSFVAGRSLEAPDGGAVVVVEKVSERREGESKTKRTRWRCR